MDFSYNAIGSYSFIYLSELCDALTLLLSIRKPFLHSCEVDLGDVSRQLIYALLCIWLIHVVHLADTGFNMIKFFYLYLCLIQGFQLAEWILFI